MYRAPYLEKRGHAKAVEMLKAAKPDKSPLVYKGSSGVGKNRDDFGKNINEILDGMSEADRLASVRVFDNDLEGSCGLHHIRKAHPEVYVSAGIMERGNFSAAAGFGYEKGKQGIFGTFSAFLEMVVSEITMARLNQSNAIAHFSHAGVDDMADNTCHFGINNMFAHNGLSDDGHDTTRLYFPADQHQFGACIRKIFNDPGLRFVFSTRSALVRAATALAGMSQRRKIISVMLMEALKSSPTGSLLFQCADLVSTSDVIASPKASPEAALATAPMAFSPIL